jgi:hypothetical protein
MFRVLKTNFHNPDIKQLINSLGDGVLKFEPEDFFRCPVDAESFALHQSWVRKSKIYRSRGRTPSADVS